MVFQNKLKKKLEWISRLECCCHLHGRKTINQNKQQKLVCCIYWAEL